MNNKLRVSVTPRIYDSGLIQLRFRAKGRPEATESLGKGLSKNEIEEEVVHYRRQIRLGWDPWEKKDEDILLSKALLEFINYKIARDWNDNTADGQLFRIEQMLNHLKGIPKRNNAPAISGKNQRVRIFKIIKQLPEVPISNFKDWEWWEKPEWKGKTKEGFFITTRSFLKWLDKRGYRKYEVLKLAKKTKVEANTKPLRAITFEQLNDICNAYLWLTKMNKLRGAVSRDFNPMKHIHLWNMIFRLLLRKSEIPKVRQLDVENEHINLKRKGGKEQRLKIYKSLKPHIDWFRDNQVDEKPFFGLKSMGYAGKILNRAARLALGEDWEGDYGFHMLRHAGITHMIYEGITITTVSDYAAHSTVAITLDRYAHVIKEKAMEELNNLD